MRQGYREVQGCRRQYDCERDPDERWRCLSHLPQIHAHGKDTKRTTCRRTRMIGNSAKDCTENRVSANTDTFVESRDARTTDAEIAAFIERTEVSLGQGNSGSYQSPRGIEASLPFLVPVGLSRRAIIGQQRVQNEQACRECPNRVRRRGCSEGSQHRRKCDQGQEHEERRFDSFRSFL